MRTRSVSKATAVVLTSLALVGISGTAANAASEPKSQETGDYCTYNLDNGEVECFATDAQARSGVEDIVMEATGQPNHHGKPVYFKSERGCKGKYVRGIRDLRKVDAHLPEGQNWNNRISSIYMENGCKAKFYGRKDYQGKHTGWLGDTDRMGRVPGGWNDAATSFKIA